MKHAASAILIFGMWFQTACSNGPPAPLEMTTLASGDDHEKIAHYYRHEAMRSRQQAEGMANQAAVYEQLFGRDSDWVSGARLLVQFYQEMANEDDRLADLHLNLANDRRSKPPVRQESHQRTE